MSAKYVTINGKLYAEPVQYNKDGTTLASIPLYKNVKNGTLFQPASHDGVQGEDRHVLATANDVRTNFERTLSGGGATESDAPMVDGVSVLKKKKSEA